MRTNQKESKKLCRSVVASCTLLIMLTNVWGNDFRPGTVFVEPVNTLSSPPLLDGLGRIDKVWIEERIKVGEKNGLRIHVKFKVKNAVGSKCRIRANFYTAGGSAIVPLPGANEYRDESGHAVVTKDFSPKYPTTDYLDTKLAIPYWVLNLKENNENKMKFFVAVRCGGDKIAESEWVPFSLPLGKAN